MKTERKYSYSEYRPLFSRATSQACGQMLGTSLQWGRARNQVLGSLSAGAQSPALPSFQRGSRNCPFSSRMVPGLDKWTSDM